ncbi:MAG: threonylcarbamoyl-AMP synthase [Saprospiraceae bacterium]|nr:threonylcarbamoyl-AMP synthase [Saprospiraceae bacterium]MBP6565824.1 threonylcarbamoyl-AMP synthase [Saprospiraceae bacterium]
MPNTSFIGHNIDIAATLLKKGEAVAIPTETVYGLAANALNTSAVAKIFQIKQRPTFDPLIIHLSSFEKVYDYVLEVPEIFEELAKKFMPGPLTLLLRKKDIIPDLVTAGSPYVAVRIPSHNVTKSLLDMVDFPLAAPSANPFGYISPTTAQHVADQLGNKVYYILDGGPCDVGLESTIIGMNENGDIEVLRKGGLSIESIQEVVGNIIIRDISSSNPEAPGMLTSHYAPKVPLILTDLSQLNKVSDINRTGIISFRNFLPTIPTKHQIVLSPSGNFMDAARNLFKGMRYLDGCDLDIIYAELAPEEDLGIAINDRLRRAAHR